jgi:protein-arginine kinase activator protein McsA
MNKCVLCNQPLPETKLKSKKSKNLVCDTCNDSILKDATSARESAAIEDDDEPEDTSEILYRIKHLEKSLQELQDMIEASPEACADLEETVESFPKGIQGFLHTPIKSYKMMQFLLAISKGEYMDSIARKDSDLRLKKALEDSIEQENFRKSAEIRDKINAKKQKMKE